MTKLTRNQKLVADKVEIGKAYTLKDASKLVKDLTTTKFDASVDIDVRLGVDPRKANQMVRGVVSLPNGTGKVTRVLCLCTPDQEVAAKEAGADYVGLDEYIDKIKDIKQGKIDFKVDKAGIIHTSIGKVSMSPEQIFGNAKEFILTVNKLKPAAAKGTYIKSIFISSTMSRGIKIDPKSAE